MAITGVGGATPNEEPKNISGNEQDTQNAKKPSKNVSVWDSNADGTVSIDEQMQAIEESVIIKIAKKCGFKMDDIKSNLNDINTIPQQNVGDNIFDYEKKAAKLVKDADNKVQELVVTYKNKAKEFLVDNFLNHD